jgi:hypothetical protein
MHSKIFNEKKEKKDKLILTSILETGIFGGLKNEKSAKSINKNADLKEKSLKFLKNIVY